MGVDTPLAALSERPRLLRGLLQAALRAGHEPRHRPAARDARDEPAHVRRRAGQPARRVARARAGASPWPQPVLTSGDLAKLRALAARPLPHGHARLHVRRARRRPARSSGRSTRSAGRPRGASRWASDDPGALRPRRRRTDAAPIPALLATAAVHSHLVREGARTMCGLVVESGEPREVDALRAAARLRRRRRQPVPRARPRRRAQGRPASSAETAEEAQARYVQARRQGPAQGALQDGHLDRHELPRRADLRGGRPRRPTSSRATSPGTLSRVGGHRPRRASRPTPRRAPRARARRGGELDPGGDYAYRLRGEHHVWNPEVDLVAAARRARRAPRELPRVRRRRRRGEPPRRRRCAACSSSCPPAEPLPLDEVEPSSEIVRRFATGAMSLGSISHGGARDARDRA